MSSPAGGRGDRRIDVPRADLESAQADPDPATCRAGGDVTQPLRAHSLVELTERELFPGPVVEMSVDHG